MKKIITAILLICTLVSLTVFADDVKPVTVTLNGEKIDCEAYGQGATIVDGRTMVPLRAIFEALGASVDWNQSTKTVTSTLDEVQISLSIGSNELLKNGEKVLLDVPARIMNMRTVVPVRAVSEAFGVDVVWDKETRTVALLQDKYIKGSVSDGKFLSEYIGLEFILPEGFAFASEGELRRLMGIGAGVADTDIDYSEIDSFYEFMVSDEKGNSIQLISQKKQYNQNLSDYISQIKKAYDEMEIECETSYTYHFSRAGKTFKAFDVTFEMYGLKVTQTTAVLETESRFAVFMATYLDEAAKETILYGFMEN